MKGVATGERGDMSHFHTFAAVLSPTIGTGDIAGVARATTAAFSSTLAVFSGLTVSVGLMLLAFSTIISWSCYGDRCFQCLFGNGAALRIASSTRSSRRSGRSPTSTSCGTFRHSERGQGAPNLVALLALSGTIIAETRDYERRRPAGLLP